MGYDCGSGYGGRRYYSRDEKIEWLQGYAQELENELKGVKERLAEVKASAEA